MIEIRLAAKETVKLSFGGQHGWPLYEHVVSEEDLSAKEKERVWLREQKTLLEGELSDLRARKRQAPEIVLMAPSIQLPPISKEQVAEALKEALGRRLAPEWSPIETAPKDTGKPILVVEKNWAYSRMDVVFWFNGRWSVSNSANEATENSWRPNATHWMPLPEPPK